MSERELSAREKGDLFWRKFRHYAASAESKGGKRGSIFNVDTAADVLRYYEQEKVEEIPKLGGNEFADRPPTAAGKNALAHSVARMMRVSEQLKNLMEDDRPVSSEEPDEMVIAGIKELSELIDSLIGDFFSACGTDIWGEPVKDRMVKKQAEEDFFLKRSAYERLVKSENLQLGRRLLESVLKDSGFAPEQKDAESDTVFESLLENGTMIATLRKLEVERLRERSGAALREASELEYGRSALKAYVKKKLKEDIPEARKRLLNKISADYSAEAGESIRELLYLRETALYQLKWLLFRKPVDGIMAERIEGLGTDRFLIDEHPWQLEGRMRLSDIPGFVAPKEAAYVQVNSTKEVLALGKELKQYLTEHPWQFDAQCLLSLATETEGFGDILAKAYGVLKAMDRITLDENYGKRPEQEREELFEIWVMCELMNRVGYTALEFIDNWQFNTVEEATPALRRILPEISYSLQERGVRELLQGLLKERSAAHVCQ